MPIYEWECQICGETKSVVNKVAFRDEFPEGEQDCCESPFFKRKITGVNFMSTERHVSPRDRDKDRSFQELKEASKVRQEMYDLPVGKRKEHEKEIKKLTSLKKD